MSDTPAADPSVLKSQAIAEMLATATESIKTMQAEHEADKKTIAALTLSVEKMQKSLLAMKEAQVVDMANQGSLGFTDKEMAKSFVEFGKAVFNGSAQGNTKALNTLVDNEGGFLVPEEFIPTLIRTIETFGVLRRQARVFSMPARDIAYPRQTKGTAAYWIDEGQTIMSDEPRFDMMKMTTKKLGVIVPMTSELVEDSSIGIANIILTMIAEGIAKEEDRVGFKGKVITGGGGDVYNGALYDPNVVSYYTAAGKVAFTDITFDDIANLTTMIDSPYLAGAGFKMSRTMFNRVRTLKDTDGHYIWAPPGGTSPGLIWGYPYELLDIMPQMTDSAANAPAMLFGNMSGVWLGDRRNLSILSTPIPGFVTDTTHVRALERICISVAEPQKLAVLRTAAV
jgi:HK97 family phage major capsid protein